MKPTIVVTGLVTVLLTSVALADSNGFSAGQMWGTDPAGVSVNGATESSLGHINNGLIAGQVNAARAGVLIGSGDGMTFQTIGSQSIVSSTIFGDDNFTALTTDQQTDNSGTVESNVEINSYR